MERTLVGIDVGTSKVCTLVGQIDDRGVLRISGVGVVPSRGVRKGVITDIEEATKAIGESVEKAERVSGVTVSEAYVGVGGAHISSQNSRGVVAIGKGDRPVDRDDVERAMEAAQAVAMPHNRRIIHCVPREYVIDGQDGIKNPLGMMGYRLEVETHIVTGAMTSIQNLVHCVERNQIEVTELVVQPLAAAEVVLSKEERDIGVALVDMGGGTTTVAIYVEGSVWETLVFAVGGWHVTRDIAIGLQTSSATAESIKIRYARAAPSMVEDGEVIEISTFGDEGLSSVSRRKLCEIVGSRAEEVLDLVSREIKRSGFDNLLPAGVVITGGSANLTGIRELAERKLQLPVRIGMPRRLHGLTEAISSPVYATSVGLLSWAQRQEEAALGKEPSSVSGDTWRRRLVEWLRVFLPRS